MIEFDKIQKKFIEKYSTEESVKQILEPIVNNICAETGLHSVYYLINKYYPDTGKYKFYFNDEYIGDIRLCLNSRMSTVENIVEKYIFSFFSELKMKTETTITETSCICACKISLEKLLNKDIKEEKEYKKCVDWIKLLIKQYKVLLVKKKKFELDTDFE